MPLLKVIMKFYNQDISKTITARIFKLGQLIMSRLSGENNNNIFFELLPFAKDH